MSESDPKSLDQAFALLRQFAAELTIALQRISELRQANLASVHLSMALIGTLSAAGQLKYSDLAKSIRKMQESLAVDTGSAIAQKHLADFAVALEELAPWTEEGQAAGDPLDHEERLISFLKSWTGDTEH